MERVYTVPSLDGTHLAWKVGDGENFLLGIDPIVGLHSSFSFPEDLRSYLEYLNICTLAQAQNYFQHAQSYWLSTEDLDLGGTYNILWKDYIEGLSRAGIWLID